MSSTLCYLVTAVVAFAAAMVASQGIGHLAPLVPQEFTAEMVRERERKSVCMMLEDKQ